jgi:EmrB/QacA subfamily drug resistance transporter
VFAGLMLVMLLAALDQTIVATALPTIVQDLGGLQRLSWVTSAYLLAQTAVIPLYGKLGDLLGRKRVLQSAVVIFLVGSALCGLAGSMTALIAARAVQGLGAGGLIVLVQATVGDVVPPRERGRYQGLFGAVFGVASVAGPVLGGLIVEHTTWRWIFYVNLPFGALALLVLGATLPTLHTRARPVIDYLGATLLAGSVSAIVLVTSLGGTTWPWDSAQVVLVSAAAVVLAILFLAVERRAREPVVPPAVLGDEVFRVTAALSLIVGFALFGSVVFLPLFFQTVNGAGPIASGLRLTPMMVGLLLTSVVSGRLISRFGRYKPFPVAGSAVLAVGMLLLARLDVDTGGGEAALYLLVVGLGLGMVMPVLILAVQNAMDYAVLGTATSGVTLARGMGGALGTAVFGTIFTNRLESQLESSLGGRPGASAGMARTLTGDEIARLPATLRSVYQTAYVHALRPVFVVAAGAAALGFLLSWRLRERPLKATAATSSGLEDALAAPKGADSLAEIDRALSVLVSRERRRAFHARVAERAGVDISPGAVWALTRLDAYGFDGTFAMARRQGIEEERIAAVVEELRERGLVTGPDGEAHLTPAGRAIADQVLAARRQELDRLLADPTADRDPRVDALLARLSVELAGQRP